MSIHNGPPGYLSTGYVYTPYVPLQNTPVISATTLFGRRRIITPVSAKEFEFFFKLSVEWSKRFPIGTRLSFDQEKNFGGGFTTTSKITIPSNYRQGYYGTTTQTTVGKLPLSSSSTWIVPSQQVQQESEPYWKKWYGQNADKTEQGDNTWQYNEYEAPSVPEKYLTPVIVKSIAIPLDDFSRIGILTDLSADENEFWNIEDFEEFADFFETFSEKFETAPKNKKRK